MSASRLAIFALLPLLLLIPFQNTILSFVQSRIANPPSRLSVVFASCPHFSHLEKVIPFAEGLAKLGYDVHFVTGRDFENTIDKSLINFEPLDGISGTLSDEDMQTFLTLPPAEGNVFVGKVFFIDRLGQYRSTVQRLFQRLKNSGSRIAYISEIAFMGLLPEKLGSDGILPDASLAIGLAPIAIDSNDTFPFLSGKLPDTSPDRKAIHHKANVENQLTGDNKVYNEALTTILAELGATRPHPGFWNAMVNVHDYLLQLGIPEFEYERSDMVPELVFLGAPEKTGGGRTLPTWWGDIEAAKKAGKKIVVVSQGSAFPDLQAVLVPVLKALKDRDDLFVIGTTVTVEPEEVPGIEIPDNARVAKFIPFDLLMPEATLLICAGGYGTALQAVAAGVPWIHAGVSQDKLHTGLLAAYKGIAIDLETATPTVKQLVDGVNKILGDGKSQKPDPSYHRNIQTMSQAMKAYKPVKILEQAMLSALAGSKKRI